MKPAKKVDDPKELERQYAEEVLKVSEFYKKNKIYAFCDPTDNQRLMEKALGEKIWTPPNPKQRELIEGWKDPTKKVFTLTGGNRLGKTVCGVVISIATMMGKWPWDDVPIYFPHKRARRIRYVGSGWESHIKAVVIPALKQWWPANRPVETKKNNQGVEAIWKDRVTGSTLEIMSTSQQSDVYEGWDGDLVVYDEPPPRDIRVACARGLIDRQGREFFVATLLKEAWLSREVIKARLTNGQVDRSVFNVVGETYDNLGFGLTREGIDQFEKTLRPDEIEARLRGKPSYLSSLVCPRFDRDMHVKERFKIPLDWLITISIDFHPSRKWAITFMATAKNNFKYICDEIWEHGNPKYIAEEIIRRVKQNNYRVEKCVIDPLAKGDGNNDQTVYEIVGDTLASYNISLETASKDKDNGIAILNNLLWTENAMPGLFYFSDCIKSIEQTEDWIYDPETFKPSKEDDDFVETIYRLALLNTEWYPPTIYDVSNQKSMIL